MPKKWKAYLIDESVIASYDKSTKKARMLSDYQTALLLSQCKQLYWLSRYLNLSIPMSELEPILADMEHELMLEGDCMTIDCALIEDCLPDSATIQNIYKLSVNIEDSSIVAINNTRLNNYYSSTNIYEVYPLAPSSYFDGSQTSSERLCIAVSMFVKVMTQRYSLFAAIEQSNPLEGLSMQSSLIEIAQTLGLEALAYITPSFAFNMMTNTIVNLGANLAALSDIAALNEYICCLQESLSRAALSYTGYLAALSSASSCVSAGNASTIAALMSEVMESERNYLYLIELLSKTHESGYSSGLDCNCVSELDCSSGSITLLPPLSPYITPPSSLIFHNGSIVTSVDNVNLVWKVSYSGGYIEYTNSRACIAYIQFSRRGVNLSGTGTLFADCYIDGSFTKSVTISAGSTQTNEVIYPHATNSHYPTSTIRLVLRASSTLAGNAEITNIRVSVKG